MKYLWFAFLLYVVSLGFARAQIVAPQRSGANSESETDPAKLIPLPQIVPVPQDNPTTPVKVELGKKLFFDPRLSGNNKVSCATCHMPEKGYGDGLALSPGADGKPLARNTQTCLNVGFYRRFFWDGRAESLEEQALGPIESTVEMNQSVDALETELAAIPGYVTEFEHVFGMKPNKGGIAKALAAFQRTLVTKPSPFDRFLAGDKNALSSNAKKGLELFQGEAGCVRCHNGPLLSDGKFYRIGVLSKDEGRAIVTGSKEDRYRFRTPTLRNISRTGPYMHNGSMKTLEDVVTFYYRAIPAKGRDGLALDVEALSNRSFAEIPLLVEFLDSLTGKAPAVVPPKLP
ncbi:MAG: cytochrome-c peroxidase [Pirellulales bacterium]